MPKFKSSIVFPNDTTQASAVTDLDSLTDVVITSPSSSQTITYNGSNWVNSTGSVSFDDDQNILSNQVFS